MENASKAILIAAAVLIVVLLIAFGMRIFNSTKGTGEALEEGMTTAEIAQFNNKFTSYMGTQSLAKIRALANVVNANNATSDRKVYFGSTDNDTASEITNYAASLQNPRYTVTFVYDNNGKLIVGITLS